MTKTMDIDNNNEDLIHTKTVFRRHSKGPVMFNGCSPSGDVIIIDNISQKKSYDLTGWYIERQTDSQQFLRYTFTNKFILPPMTTIELWSTTSTPISISNELEHNQSPESYEQKQTFIIIKTKLLTWNTARQWNAVGLLGQQISGLFSGLFTDLFGGFGKRGLSDLMNINIGEVVNQFAAQVKQIYQRLITVFAQIVQHAEDWIQKPDWARIEFARAGADAEQAISQIHLGVEFLQPLVNLVQTHLQALIPDFEGIIHQVLAAIQHPVQSLIGTGGLLQP
ncbi:unnamed protein product [Rotaria sp. Silwood2]|nr:unnamed protein product [Rotaria sp. Silwood2]